MPNYSITDTEVLINCCYGGFGFNDEFVAFLEKRGLFGTEKLDKNGLFLAIEALGRTNTDLIAAVKEFGIDRVSGRYSKIQIRVVPAFYNWHIDEYDGLEGVEYDLPWETIARASLAGDTSHPLLAAIANGELVLPPPFQQN